MIIAVSSLSSYPPPPSRNTSLQQELVALRRKEEEDTRSLEEMAQKVESNLVATTVSILLIAYTL